MKLVPALTETKHNKTHACAASVWFSERLG